MSTDPRPGLETMLKLVASLPEQLNASKTLQGLEEIKPSAGGARRMVLCAMGGSAIGGDLVQGLLGPLSVSLDVWRNYGLPHWVGPDDLVIAASYSGNTEECLAAVAEARSRGCSLLFISSGGQLAELVEPGESLVQLPSGLPPRAALGYSFGALLQVLGRLGILEDVDGQVADAVTILQDGQDHRELSPFGLASKLEDRLPVLYAADPLAFGVAQRWKGQLNENAKVPALVANFPELNHNDIVGWGLPETWHDRFVLVILRSGLESPRLQKRIQLTAALLEDEFSAIEVVAAEGQSDLARVMSLVQFGDLVSCHLAELRGVDPMPVTRIDQLKKGLCPEASS